MKKAATILLFIFCIGQVSAQEMVNVGFLPQYRFALIDQIDFSKITHLNLAFANPDSLDRLSFNGRDIKPAVDLAKAAGNKVFISLAGGFLTEEWAASWARLTMPENRGVFISHIKEYVIENNTDGVDVDLEWSHVDENYSGFVIELADTLKAAGLQVTSSLPCIYRYPEVSDEALATFDWVNIMAYDLTGSWAPQNPGPHSPIDFAFDGINYWKNQGVAPDRLTLGVPFYGYNFNGNEVTGRTYRDIISSDRSLAFKDISGSTFYNGIPTIRSKVNMARVNELKGLMIWELGQDSFDELSLLNALWDQLNGIFLANEKQGEVPRFFPIPLEERLNFSESLSGSFELHNVVGAKVWGFRSSEKINSVSLPQLSQGIYFFSYENDGRFNRIKVVK